MPAGLFLCTRDVVHCYTYCFYDADSLASGIRICPQRMHRRFEREQYRCLGAAALIVRPLHNISANCASQNALLRKRRLDISSCCAVIATLGPSCRDVETLVADDGGWNDRGPCGPDGGLPRAAHLSCYKAVCSNIVSWVMTGSAALSFRALALRYIGTAQCLTRCCMKTSVHRAVVLLSSNPWLSVVADSVRLGHC